IRRELFITGLQHPRPDKTVVLHLQATQVRYEVAIISDAELLITRSQQDKFHLILRSRNRCTVLTSSCLIPSSLSRLLAPTDLPHLLGDGEVFHYPNSFRFLSFHNPNGEWPPRSERQGANPIH
ncbi:hypothetical protein N657DRAFT_580821, partial [Parathielavia appendiculata]